MSNLSPAVDPTQHPYRRLLNFAFATHEQELQRASLLTGKRPQGPAEWGPHFQAREAE
jgi:hypothetical protein